LNIRGGKLNEIANSTLSLKSNLYTLDKASIKPSDIYFRLKDFNAIAIRANSILALSQDVRKHLKFYLKKLRMVKTSISGKNLLVMGVQEGHQIGYILERLLKAKLDGEIRTKEEEAILADRLISDLKSPGMYK
jgi:tRNA nucleotidyltransferase (CCA-adding enzyme)